MRVGSFVPDAVGHTSSQGPYTTAKAIIQAVYS